jgi:D-psicose/D-tagatose/L-ribulose 3-epimerase
MKFGMNLLLWSGELSAPLLNQCEKLKKMGYDGVEIPLFNLDLDYAWYGKRFDDLGLGRTAVTIRTAADNPISPDRAVRQAGIEATCRAIECCAAAGATHLVGPFHSALGVFSGTGPTADEWKWGVECMRPVAEHAAAHNVILGVEGLNRFETYLLTSVAETVRFVQEVGHSACRVMYDTFHANIEEKNVRNAIRAAGNLLCHVHISENDRSTPGSGHIDWYDTFASLQEIGYDGWLMVEAFGLALPELQAATRIWRRMYETEEKLAWDALEFMKSQVAEWAG